MPTTIQDKYEIVITQTFATNVPLPVLVTEPPVINLPEMLPGQVFNGEFSITNYGLIAVVDVKITFPTSFLDYDIEVFTSSIPTRIGAQQKITLPFRVTKRQTVAAGLNLRDAGNYACNPDSSLQLFTASALSLLFDEVRGYGAGCVTSFPIGASGTAETCPVSGATANASTSGNVGVPTSCPTSGGGTGGGGGGGGGGWYGGGGSSGGSGGGAPGQPGPLPTGDCGCMNCDDNNSCTDDSCSNGACTHEPVVCDGGDPCTVNWCEDGCQSYPLDCDDGNGCTDDSCGSGGCVNTPIDCDGGDPCTVNWCEDGCQSYPLDCDDGNPCTDDSCGAGGCINTPRDCDDGNACTTDSCVSGSCINTSLDCDDGDGCTVNWCENGGCQSYPLDCEDGDPCSVNWCENGGCQSYPLDCDDGNPCTDDSCGSGGCINTPRDCDDGNSCTNDSCEDGLCINTSIDCEDGDGCTVNWCENGGCQSYPLDCEDGDPCSVDWCENGGCQSYPLDCDDGNPCTDDSCGSGGCINTPKDCDDGNACTDDSCQSGSCINTSIDCDDGDGCTVNWCENGGCQSYPLDCEDGDPCTVDWCENGGCQSYPLDCDDGNPCTDDSCGSGGCISTPKDCDDGNACTTDSCQSGSCVNTPSDCEDGDPCTVNWCEGEGCQSYPLDCEDGDPCTVDWCGANGCESYPLDCDDGDPCTDDSCGPNGCVNAPKDCEDNDPCTVNWCENGGCQSYPLDCDDGDPCTDDSCGPNGCVNTPKDCEDNDPCTVNWCENGDCQSYPLDCDDGDPCTEDSCGANGCENTPITGPIPDDMCNQCQDGVKVPVPDDPATCCNIDGICKAGTCEPVVLTSVSLLVNLNKSAVVYTNQPVSFTAIPDGNCNFTYFWDFGDGSGDMSTTSSISHTYTAIGIYNATVYVNCDCTDAQPSDTVEVVACADAQTTQTSSLKAGSLSLSANSLLDLNPQQCSECNLKAEGECCNQNTPNPGVCKADLFGNKTCETISLTITSAYADGKETDVVPIDQTVNYSVTATGNCDITYFWDFGDGSGDSTTSTTINHSYSSPGVYDVSVYANCNCFNDQPMYMLQTYVVKIDSISGRGKTSDTDSPDTTKTIFIMKGSIVTFTAAKTPSSAPWPDGKPSWSGSSGASGSGETITVTFDTVSSSKTDYKTIEAECGNRVKLNVLVYDTVLGVHSSLQNEIDPSYTDGHAWITVTDVTSGLVTTYGLWPDDHWLVIQRGDNNDGSDVRVNYESSSGNHNRYYMLFADEKQALISYINTPSYWTITNTCAAWASDCIMTVVGEDVDADDMYGFETPRELAASIDALEASDPTSRSSPSTGQDGLSSF